MATDTVFTILTHTVSLINDGWRLYKRLSKAQKSHANLDDEEQQLKDAMSKVRQTEELMAEVQPRERDLIELVRPGFFSDMTHRLILLRNGLRYCEQDIGSYRENAETAVVGRHDLKVALRHCVLGANQVYMDLLKSTNAANTADGGSRLTEFPAWGPTNFDLYYPTVSQPGEQA
ncbi:hypothetical protein BKA93DRAFT_772427 [Sparassis latifolia]